MIITHIVTASSEIFFTKGSFWEECYSKFIGTLKNSTQFDTVLYSTSLKEPDIYNRLKTRKKTQNSRPLTKKYYISFPIKFYWFSLKPGLKFVLQEFWSKANSEREIQPKKKFQRLQINAIEKKIVSLEFAVNLNRFRLSFWRLLKYQKILTEC